MSRIDELIAEHCPDGVEFVTLAELLDYQQPNRFLVKSVAYNDSFTTPVLTAGQTFILGYTDETEGVYPASTDAPVIIFDDFTTAFKWVNFPFKAKSSAMKILCPKPNVDLRFVWFAMQTIPYRPQDHARQWIGKYSRFRIPFPPLEVQREIVRILDTFSKMEAELEAELEARKQQYEHYRHTLLSDSETQGIPTELGQLGKIVTGRTPKASDNLSWGEDVDFITPSDIKNGMKRLDSPSRRLSNSGAESLSKAIIPAGSLLVTCIGADMGKTVINANTCATNQQINSITLNSGIDTDFVFHVLTSMRDKIRAQGERAGGTMPIINKSDFSKIMISLPPLPEQKRIAAILDKFDALVNDLSIGLPAELAARRQQYEYYRDKLLTFKQLEPAS